MKHEFKWILSLDIELHDCESEESGFQKLTDAYEAAKEAFFAELDRQCAHDNIDSWVVRDEENK